MVITSSILTDFEIMSPAHFNNVKTMLDLTVLACHEYLVRD